MMFWIRYVFLEYISVIIMILNLTEKTAVLDTITSTWLLHATLSSCSIRICSYNDCFQIGSYSDIYSEKKYSTAYRNHLGLIKSYTDSD